MKLRRMNELDRARAWFIRQLKKCHKGTRQQLADEMRSIRRGDIDFTVMQNYKDAMKRNRRQ